ncbi:MAG: bifunctional phosphopantothenoylcysteine decarboxylase/phosphopantothenate--cysteine ligase CoaBC [Saprospiraceae bacterium]
MPSQNNILEGRKIILGITGSIAAYKSVVLLRLLMKAGAEVQVIMTESAHDFIGPLTLSSLSTKEVLSKLNLDQEWSQHVALGQWADLLMIAPASANTISKCAHGIVDNLLTAVYLSAKCPIMIAPAMDLDMWRHPATQENISKLNSFGHFIVPVEDGPLASGLSGPGRLAEPEIIFKFITNYFLVSKPFEGIKILITAGPTYEAIDPVRFIGNHSSGKMGIQLAEQAVQMGAEVELILGPSNEEIKPHPKLHITRIISAENLYQEVNHRYQDVQVFILAAAVADFKPEHTALEKIKKDTQSNMTLSLVPTHDIAAFLGQNKRENQFLCGFALETENQTQFAKIKMSKKNMDMIVVNSTRDEGATFHHDTNKISILDNSGNLVSFDLKSKKEVAIDILKYILERIKT